MTPDEDIARLIARHKAKAERDLRHWPTPWIDPHHEPAERVPYKPRDRPAVVGHADFMDDAACKGVDQNTFYPGPGESSRPAKTICGRCPVRKQCLEHALVNNEEHGIWGGVTEPQRNAMRQARKDVA